MDKKMSQQKGGEKEAQKSYEDILINTKQIGIISLLNAPRANENKQPKIGGGFLFICLHFVIISLQLCIVSSHPAFHLYIFTWTS